MKKIIVRYWRGTTQVEATASTYQSAMRIASRNQNAYPPTFWTLDGERLHDNGYCLCKESDIEKAGTSGVIHAYA